MFETFFTCGSYFRHCRAFIFRLLGSFPRTTTRIHLFWRVGYKHPGKPNFGRNLLRCKWNFNVSIYRSLIMTLISTIFKKRVTSDNVLSSQIDFDTGLLVVSRITFRRPSIPSYTTSCPQNIGMLSGTLFVDLVSRDRVCIIDCLWYVMLYSNIK